MNSNGIPFLPLNQIVVSKAQSLGIQFSKKTYVIAAQHLLDDTLDLFHSLIALGIPAQNIFALGKTYSNVPHILTKMKQERMQLLETTAPPLGEFYPYFHREILLLWQNLLKKYKDGAIEQILILDDGGILISKTPAQIFENLRPVGEEQTTSGLYQLEKQQLLFPIVSEASSAVKMIFESPMFTQAAISRVMSRTQSYSNFNKSKCGVIGLGSIGSSLAINLLLMGCDVYTHDVVERPEMLNTLKKAKKVSLHEMLETCDYIFGCTGKDLFEHVELPFKHKDGQIYSSVSSGDIEFLSLIKYIKKQECVQTENKDVILKSQYGKITILQNGYPINFDGKQGSASPKYTQLTTSMLLSGLIQAYLLQERPDYQSIRHTLVAHSPEAQRFLLSRWFQEVPEMKDKYPQELIEKSENLDWFYQNSKGTVVSDETMLKMFPQ